MEGSSWFSSLHLRTALGHPHCPHTVVQRETHAPPGLVSQQGPSLGLTVSPSPALTDTGCPDQARGRVLLLCTGCCVSEIHSQATTRTKLSVLACVALSLALPPAHSLYTSAKEDTFIKFRIIDGMGYNLGIWEGEGHYASESTERFSKGHVCAVNKRHGRFIFDSDKLYTL